LIPIQEMTLKGSQRLPKAARLRKRREFQKLSQAGAKLQSANFVVISGGNGGQECRLGITVSGKVGNSVTRNRIKRQVREFFRRRRADWQPGTDFLVIARKSAAGLAGRAVASELARAFADRSLRRAS
jgi:ribonuclease P protein component